MNYGIVTYVRLPADIKEKLDEIATAEYTTVASLLRRAAIQYVATHDAAQPPQENTQKKTAAKQPVAAARPN
jgi:predicted transcriptional regulator